MGWIQYYDLLEKYNGDLSRASEEEMGIAFRGNPNDPITARRIAEEKWRERSEGKIEN